MIDSKLVLKTLDHRIRSSLAYTQWVEQNKSSVCFFCGGTNELQVHHIVLLYHEILGLWNIYKDEDEVVKHVCDRHASGMIEGITLCKECHEKLHSGRVRLDSNKEINTDMWCAIPRMLNPIPNHAKTKKEGMIGLIAYQTLLGIGWYIMNGHVEMRMLQLQRRRFAQLLGKTPGASFNKSLDDALEQLKDIGVLDDTWRNENDLEIYISKDYLEMMEKSPWFVPLKEIKTNSMCVLCLRLWLGMQASSNHYAISLKKLKGHIGITDLQDGRVSKTISKALTQIPWVKMKEDDNCLRFKFSGRLPTPIRRLRMVLTDCLEQSK